MALSSELGRLFDIVLGVFFALFVIVSFAVEAPVCMGEPVLPTSPNFFVRKSYEWGIEADMLWVKMPQWTRIAVCYHAFGFGTCYLLFAIIFLFGTKWLPSFIMCICSAKLYAGALYMTANLLNEQYPPSDPRLFVLQSASYMVIPFLAIIRANAWRSHSKPAAAAATPKKTK